MFMENALNVSVSPFQLFLAAAFQLWIIFFPIFILRKLNRIEKALNDLIVEDDTETES